MMKAAYGGFQVQLEWDYIWDHLVAEIKVALDFASTNKKLGIPIERAFAFSAGCRAAPVGLFREKDEVLFDVAVDTGSLPTATPAAF